MTVRIHRNTHTFNEAPFGVQAFAKLDNRMAIENKIVLNIVFYIPFVPWSLFSYHNFYPSLFSKYKKSIDACTTWCWVDFIYVQFNVLFSGKCRS